MCAVHPRWDGIDEGGGEANAAVAWKTASPGKAVFLIFLSCVGFFFCSVYSNVWEAACVFFVRYVYVAIN